MSKNSFLEQAIQPTNSLWANSIERSSNLPERTDDIRSEFWRDYNRILHCKAYRRLKHKTQVFHSTSNDHICTRIEHVAHVSSVSYTICNYLGLNTELAAAISLGHDIGHAPFGHDGEKHLTEISKRVFGGHFWHEKNSLHFADNIETLTNSEGFSENLSLTYAVRDGLISHCGEVNETAIFPRTDYIDLSTIVRQNQYSPYTWEACVVKIADKISYLGRDIEDALRLNILNDFHLQELSEILKPTNSEPFRVINNTVLIHNFVINLCKFSSPEKGIGFTEPFLEAINKIKAFNYKYIYKHSRIENYTKFSKLIIETIFDTLDNLYDSTNINNSISEAKFLYPKLVGSFEDWLIKYSDYNLNVRTKLKYHNKRIYNLSKNLDYRIAIIDYISSMTDAFALEIYNELIRF